MIAGRRAGDRHDWGLNGLPVGFFADLPDVHFEPCIDVIGKNLAPVFAPPQDVKLIVKRQTLR